MCGLEKQSVWADANAWIEKTDFRITSCNASPPPLARPPAVSCPATSSRCISPILAGAAETNAAKPMAQSAANFPAERRAPRTRSTLT